MQLHMSICIAWQSWVYEAFIIFMKLRFAFIDNLVPTEGQTDRWTKMIIVLYPTTDGTIVELYANRCLSVHGHVK